MNQFKKSLLLLTSVTLLVGACTNDEANPSPSDPNEAITTATLTLTNQATPTESVTATIDNLNTTADLSRATLNLEANTTYTGVITLLDKTKSPTLDVSEDVKAEANEHLFVYTYTATTGVATALVVIPTDRDTNPSPGPYPIGLTTEIKTSTTGTGKLKVVLRHQPNAKNGTIAPGTTDLETDFGVVIR